MIRHLRSFICAKLARFSSKVLIRVIFSALLVSIIFYLKTIFFPDFSFLQVAYCVNVNDITSISIETHIVQDNKIEQIYSRSVIIPQENLNAEPSIPRVLSGCSNRRAARWIGSIAGLSLGFASSIWLYITSGIDFSSYACDLIDLIKRTSDRRTNR